MLCAFFSAAEKDYRISSTHLGIFAALLHCREKQGSANPVRAYACQIMEISKISSPATYHKHIKQLSEYGYLRYVPSFKKNRPSCIYFLD
nr:hypothetical protein [Flavobacterium johnsoniae]